jgi:hypothetical protein
MLLSLAVVAIAATARADDADPKKIIDKAIEAHGGAEALAKNKDKSQTFTGEMKIHLMGGIDSTIESLVGDKKFKHVMQLTIMGMNFNEIVCYDGKEFWIALDSKIVMSATGKDLDGFVELFHAEQLAKLLPLTQKGVELSIIGDSKLGERELIGVRVSKKDRKDVSLFFDKKTGLLAKMEYRTMDFMTREEVTEERELHDYKKVEGQLVPMRIVLNRDGKIYAEADISEMKFVEKLEDNTFAKP